MNKNKQFSIEEKAAFINNYLAKQKDKEFNEQESLKEKHIKSYLIIIECGLMIGIIMITNFIWGFEWLSDFSSWLTNIIVPILIFNFLNSIWMIIEKKIRRIKVWIRLLFYFVSLIATFFISSSLRVEIYKTTPIWVIVLGIVCAALSIFVFVFNIRINKKEAEANIDYEIAIMNEIVNDIKEKENSDSANKKAKAKKRKK